MQHHPSNFGQFALTRLVHIAQAALGLAMLNCFSPASLVAQSPTADVDYTRDVKPLLAEKCSACHGVLRQEAELRLDHGRLLRKGGDSGSLIDDGESENLLLQRVTTSDEDLRMPPEGEGKPLNAEQIQLLTNWLAAGAHSPADEPVPADPSEHWAWQPPTRPEIPDVSSASWRTHPIDALVYASLQDNGLQPLELADPRTRLRRLYVDLIGLPPTPEQQRDFASDPSPENWNRQVASLLENPAHGERWARHWMDVWRYSDWDGYKQQLRGSQRHIWRWRDWIVESLNADKGYDQMVMEMLAGDELAPTDPDVLRATGFLARNFHTSNRNIWLDATVEHTAKAFLSLTLNCARCHDHKYDPIPQTDYYAFRAVFEPHQVRTDRIEGQANLLKDGLVRVFDAEPEAETYLYFAGDEKRPDKHAPMVAGVPGIVGLPFKPTPVALPAAAVFPAAYGFIEREDLAAAQRSLVSQQTTLKKLEDAKTEPDALELKIAQQAVVSAEAKLNSLRARWSADKRRYGPRNDQPQADATREADLLALSDAAIQCEAEETIAAAELLVLQKQKLQADAQAAANSAASPSADDAEPVDTKQQAALATAKKDLAAADKALAEAEKALEQAREKLGKKDAYTPVGKEFPGQSTGRRLALAQWITRRDNPLAARVAVNYVWMHYFGQPLVENVFDFGLRSPTPEHLALLDWLSVELMDNHWSLKHIHHCIVTSRTYQLASHSQDSVVWTANGQIDPDNKFLWRANARRLDAEVVRDSLLAASGSLDLSMGGPDIDHQLGESSLRRSLYFRHAYEKQMTMLVLFDAAGPQECYRRSESIIPQQALALANSPLTLEQARLLAAKLWEPGHTDEEAGIIRAFEILLGRECTPQELAICHEFITQQAALLSDTQKLNPLAGKQQVKVPPASEARQRARESLVHTLMNHNDFVTVR